MTGIERLRDIAEDRYSGGMVHISVHKLREICDQIEAEAGVETVKSEAMEALAFVEEKGGLTELDRRLIPEGMVWPRFEDGELVWFGDEYVNAKGNVSTLRTIVIKDCRDLLGGGYYWKLGKGNCAVMVKNGERIKRPTVLAADGKPLEVGQTVWRVTDGMSAEVERINGATGFIDSDGTPFEARYFTHQRPVLDAYGVPINEGDTVWHIETGREYVVVEPSYGETAVVRLAKYDDADGEQYTPEQLTHTKPEPPDSWEKWREDFIKPPCVYCRDILGVEFDDDTELDKAFDAQVQDMERRARALAERDAKRKALAERGE